MIIIKDVYISNTIVKSRYKMLRIKNVIKTKIYQNKVLKQYATFKQ